MDALEPHHITDLYVLVDGALPPAARPAGGRPQVLSDSELVTALIWNGLTVQQHTLKDVWKWLRRDQRRNFPSVPGYKGFVAHCHRALPLLLRFLERSLSDGARVRLVDSTMLPVCRLCRAERHKVAQGLASFGKNGSGWHFGFKLHAAFAPDGSLAAFRFSLANESDLMQLPFLTAPESVDVGDRGYTARVMRGKLWREKRCLVVSPPRQKQDSFLMAAWQYELLRLRQKAECGFDRLKEHLQLVREHDPRGARVMLAYQLQVRGF